jgi:rhodanese-related sulfurtransferase
MITRIAAVVLSGCVMLGCRSSEADRTPPPAPPAPATETTEVSVKQATVEQVAKYMKDHTATVVDANGAETRQEYGVIPGAVLLSNHRNYAISELPASRTNKLVFYCGGTMCRASDKAAAKAVAAGYTDVSVLRDGIKGWKSAGQPTDTPRS